MSLRERLDQRLWSAFNLDVIAKLRSGGSFLFRLLTVVLYSDTSGADVKR